MIYEKDAVVTKIKRDENLSITMETTQIWCRLTETNERIKSPAMLGHTYLKVGDSIRLDHGTEEDERVNWSNYFI